ncbi:MAG TPA: hypothetical protein EYQ51_08015 [Alphaproteobacteria bacterium]|nr:hypothetical protein [Alphaproteobacteria bacterium]
MTYTKIFKYINYFTLACIIPLSYFAPMGEWLLISFLSLATIIDCFINKTKIHLNNLFVFILSLLIIMISFYWSINTERTLEVIGPITGIIIAIYITLNSSSNNHIISIKNIIGVPIILTSICILSDIILNTEIRSSLAIIAGDAPTSKSGNYSRGIIIITIIMPLVVALYIHNNNKLMALSVFLLVSLMILLGPNDTAKMALICALISSIIIYFLGPRSFLYFGIISYIFILFLPIISTKIAPQIGHIEKNITVIKPLSGSRISSDTRTQIGNTNYSKQTLPWQKTSIGGSIIHRLLVWEYVGSEILKKPLLGNGIGTSRLIGQNIVLNIPNTNQEIRGGIPLHPHNSFLEIWLELGLLGIIVISFIWIKIIKFGMNIRKNSFVIGTGVCTSIVTIFVIYNLSFGVFQAWWMASVGLLCFIILESCKYTKQ